MLGRERFDLSFFKNTVHEFRTTYLQALATLKPARGLSHGAQNISLVLYIKLCNTLKSDCLTYGVC